jgi:hypothetical protein
MTPDDARQGVAVGDGDTGEAQPGSLQDEFFRVRAAAQKREIRRQAEFGVKRSVHLKAFPGMTNCCNAAIVLPPVLSMKWQVKGR